MNHLISKSDQEFKKQVENLEFPITNFNHRAHIRLAYVYLSENCFSKNQVNIAAQHMRNTLIALLNNIGIDPTQKYHQTLTEAWTLAVHHFMNRTNHSESFDEFINMSAALLDSKIMLTHYSEDVLFSKQARRTFVEPDLDQIPRYAA